MNAGMRPIALVGLSGAGKTTMGQRLANRLCLPFLDTDAVAEEHAQATIAEVFADPDRGERYFRALEERVVYLALKWGQPMVMAVGGGAVLSRCTRDVLSKKAEVVWLRALPETLAPRIDAQPGVRPLLAGGSLERLKAMHSTRTRLYRSVAHLTIDAHRPPAEVLEQLAMAVSR